MAANWTFSTYKHAGLFDSTKQMLADHGVRHAKVPYANIIYVGLGHYTQEDRNALCNAEYLLSNTTDVGHLPETESTIISLTDPNELIDVWATAEHTLFLIFSALKKSPSRRYLPNRELHSKAVYVAGTGRVAGQVRQLMIANGAHITDQLNTADIVTIHLPATEENHQWLDPQRVKSLKHDCIVCNTSRHTLVDEDAIGEAANRAKIEYVTDFPVNCKQIATDHVGGYTWESLEKTEQIVTRRLLKDHLRLAPRVKSPAYA